MSHEPSGPVLGRRAVLASIAALGGGSLLASCGGGGSSGSAPSPGGGSSSVKVQLSWIKDASFVGEYVADDRGYYSDAGFAVDLLASGAGGGGTPGGLSTGKVWTGTVGPYNLATANSQGLDAKIVAVTFQKSPLCIASSAKSPIETPQDLVGKRVGVQSVNVAFFDAFLRVNGIEKDSVTAVPAQYDPTPLTVGDVDGWFSFVNSEPVALASKGFATHTLLFADYGLPSSAECFAFTQESIDNQREQIKGFLAATAKGWKEAIADPTASAELTVNKYGKANHLDLSAQKTQVEAQIPLVLTAETTEQGLLTISDTLISDNVETLDLLGLKVEGDDLFDRSLMAEVSAESVGVR